MSRQEVLELLVTVAILVIAVFIAIAIEALIGFPS